MAAFIGVHLASRMELGCFGVHSLNSISSFVCFFFFDFSCYRVCVPTFPVFSVAGTRTPDEVVAKVKTFRAQDASGLMSTVKTDLSAKSAPSSAGASAAAASAAAVASAASAPKSSPALSASAAPDASVESVSEEDDWTSSEQKALEVCALLRQTTPSGTYFLLTASFISTDS
jgi:hypothetical protein